MEPDKHVSYTLGMVLGVEDFQQEFAYLSERDRWLARELAGYGTVWGLEVSEAGEDCEVSAGVALLPSGRLVRVPEAQRLPRGKGHLVLTAADRLTDPVPACDAKGAETTVPSRVEEGFELAWVEDVPEDALRLDGDDRPRVVPLSRRPHVVAAGSFLADGAAEWTHGELALEPLGDGVFALRFPAHRQKGRYVVTGSPIVAPGDPPAALELVVGDGLLVRCHGRGLQLQITEFQIDPGG